MQHTNSATSATKHTTFIHQKHLQTASANHIGSTHGDRLSRHPAPTSHYSDTLQAGMKRPFFYTSLATYSTLVLSIWPGVDARSTTATLGVAKAHKLQLVWRQVTGGIVVNVTRVKARNVFPPVALISLGTGGHVPQKNIGWGTVMHHVPQIWWRFRCIVTECGSFLNSAQCFGIIVTVQLQPV